MRQYRPSKHCFKQRLENQKTWPASCSGFGRTRDDNICSNMNTIVEETATLPCVKRFGFSLAVGDHALTSAVLAVHWTIVFSRLFCWLLLVTRYGTMAVRLFYVFSSPNTDEDNCKITFCYVDNHSKTNEQ